MIRLNGITKIVKHIVGGSMDSNTESVMYPDVEQLVLYEANSGARMFGYITELDMDAQLAYVNIYHGKQTGSEENKWWRQWLPFERLYPVI